MKRTRTNTATQLDNAIKRYLISSIDYDYCDIDVNVTIKEKIEALRERFYSEYGWRVKQCGEKEALKDWLMGIPSAIKVYFANHDILEFSHEIGSIDLNKASDAEKDMIIEGWFDLLANKIGQLFRGYRVPKDI